MKTPKKITILIPCYNEEKNISLLYPHLQFLSEKCNDYDWEFLFVNDGSKDNTLGEIKKLRVQDPRVSYIDLSRNFGKEAAMLAGIDNASGDALVIMDADLQHPVDIIPQMINLWEEAYDDVYAKRISRGKESWLRKRFSLLYYKLLQRTTKVDILPNVGDFRLLDKKCIEALRSIREHERNTKALFCWIGYKKKEILFEQGDRIEGQSSWSFIKLLNLAIDGLTSFTTTPLRIATILGLIVSIVAFVYMCFILIKTMFYGDAVQGFPTIIVIILFLGGIQLLSLGVIGEYLGKIFHETKNRPVYLIREFER